MQTSPTSSAASSQVSEELRFKKGNDIFRTRNVSQNHTKKRNVKSAFILTDLLITRSFTQTFKNTEQFREVTCVCLFRSLVHLKEVSVCFSWSACELWFFALLSLLSSLTMKNSVCSGDGGGADTEPHRKRGKEQPAVEHQRKEKGVIEHKERIRQAGSAEPEDVEGLKSLQSKAEENISNCTVKTPEVLH